MPAPARSSSRWRVTSVIAALVALGACGIMPLQIDHNAKAPTLPGYGGNGLAISSASPVARRLFAQGMEQAYAFNEVEAVRAFKAALAQDSECAMCAWGVAWQLGPNINAVERGDLTEARRYVDHGLRHAAQASPRERALLEALAVRYGQAGSARDLAVLAAPVCSSGGGKNKADPLDIAYAARMRTLADAAPDDPDLASFYAEAEMIATRTDAWWDPATGKPAGRIGEVADRLERLLGQRPDHVGLNHYMIHAVDALPVAQRAQAAADRLGSLAPASPHLVHMPSHTYAQLGRYADASRVNAQAVALDVTLAQTLEDQGYSVSKDWRGHDSAFLWYAALMEGRGVLALDTARAAAKSAANVDHVYGEYVRSRPALTLLRLERYDEVLREPLPSGDRGMAQALSQSARGIAYVHTGHPAEAAAALQQVEAADARLGRDHPGTEGFDPAIRALSAVARDSLRAELARADGRFDAALALQAAALTSAKELDDAEPPLLAASTRLALGDLQLQARDWAAAERTFRTDLAQHPRSGWALRGLARALQGQGRTAEAATLKAQLDAAWPHAEAALRRG